ncbi:DnaT DNA-binding domain protein [compost metagenome]
MSEVGPEVGPTSGLPTGLPTTSSAREGFEPLHRFPMHDHWLPSPRGWRATAKRNGIPPESLNDEALMEFRSYWINRPDKYQSQGQWEHELAQALKRAIRRNEATGGTHHGNPATPSATGNQRPGRSRTLSAVDRVRANIEAAEAARQVAGTALDEDDRDVRPPLDVEFWRQG